VDPLVPAAAAAEVREMMPDHMFAHYPYGNDTDFEADSEADN
jgi:hypothetical protein